MTFSALGRLMFASVLASPAAIASDSPHGVNSSRLLRAIAEVETGVTDLARGSSKVGKAGERSAWQFTATTWRRYTREPFAKASTDPVLAHLVATLHLRYLVARMHEKRQYVSVFTLASAWNAGPDAKHVPAAYSTRVLTIYDSLQ